MNQRPDTAVPRQIVLCLDGTSNTLTGRQRDTNVLRLFEHLARQPDAQRLLYYDAGVGSPDALPTTGPLDWLSRKWQRAAGLAYGRGIYENVGQAYAFLMAHWRPGDQVFLFGFSRGAFTARCVAGMVNLFGVLRPEHEPLLELLMRVYFSPVDGRTQLELRQEGARALLGLERETNTTRTRQRVADQVRESFTSHAGRDAGIHFVGVWDTVASVGLPGLAVRISSKATVTGKRMRHVRQALALDEHRRPFRPRLYTEPDFGDAGAPQSLQQRWFRGAHGDVGGGYAPAESALADEALAWMAGEAGACGLRGAAGLAPGPGARALLHDPLRTVPWWALAGMTLRAAAGQAHGSVARLQAHPPPSVWDQPLRSKTAALLALGGALVGWLWHGALLSGAWWPPADLGGALQAGAAMAQAQARMLVEGPFGDWRALWAAVPRAHLGWAFAADFLLVASYAYLLGRASSWAFSRMAGRRQPGQPRPAWQVLGLALPMAAAGDVAENLLTLVGLDDPARMTGWHGLLLWAGGVGAAFKWAGLAGCVALVAGGCWRAMAGRKAPR